MRRNRRRQLKEFIQIWILMKLYQDKLRMRQMLDKYFNVYQELMLQKNSEIKDIAEYVQNMENKNNFVKKRSGIGGGHIVMNAGKQNK